MYTQAISEVEANDRQKQAEIKESYSEAYKEARIKTAEQPKPQP
jgi:hypothetical protein